MTSNEPHWSLPEKLREDEEHGRGVFGTYDDYVAGKDDVSIQSHAIIDDAYAAIYAGTFAGVMQRAGIELKGDILDAGCAVGTLTAALHTARTGPGRTIGMDLSESATKLASERYAEPEFRTGSVDELGDISDASLSLIHIREFYPFVRTSDPAAHLRFFEAFAPKLAPGGAAVAVQIGWSEGLEHSYRQLEEPCRALGYDMITRLTVVPMRYYRRFGDASYGFPLYRLITFAGHMLEAVRPGKVSYAYIFRRGGS